MDDRATLASALAGRYDIEREIGRGGMATVYLARDLRHERSVALKVLDPELGAVLGGERFLSEIRVTANLQHPNLLPLFDSGSADGLLFYVMPFVDGESLRARLDRERQLPVDEALRITVAVANALDYAHSHGVIHRDLKPENILLQHGQPVIADFGIALAVSNAGGQRVTQTGLSLGTPQYMSPEQATADRAIDGRTDIYSLGAVCYEMLTGEPPHVGATAQAVIAKLMTEEPRPLTVLRPTVPPHIDAAVRCALQKLPADRFATAAQFADALNGRATVSSLSSPAPTARASRTMRMYALVTSAVAVLLAIAAGVAGWRLSHVPTPEPVRFTIDMDSATRLDDLVGTSVAVSPDGQTIAFLTWTDNKRNLVLRRVGDLQSRVLISSPVAGPRFSPDAKWIAYYAGNAQWRISTAGGSPIPVAKSVTGMAWHGLTWRSPEAIVFAAAGRIYQVSANGGTPRLIAIGDSARGQTVANLPLMLPDGRTVAFQMITSAGPRLALASIDSGPMSVLDLPISTPLGYVDGWLVFSRRDGTAAAVRLDIGRRRISGDAVQVLDDAISRFGINAALSPGGTLSYYRGTGVRRDLLIVDLHGTTTYTSASQLSYSFPSWSPDGNRIAVTIEDGSSSTSDVWVMNVASRVLSRVTTSGGMRPSWTPDGRRIAYIGSASPSSDIFTVPVDASAAPARLVTGRRFREIEFAPDGKSAVVRIDQGTDATPDILAMTMDSAHTLTPLAATTFAERMPAISPDGRWIAYHSNETGHYEVYVRPFASGGGRVQISTDGGTEPRWAHDGKRLFYRGHGSFRVANLAIAGSAITVTSRDSLFEDRFFTESGGRPGYDVHPDGKHLVVLRDASGKQSIVVVVNWLTELRGRLRH
jgi:eukaryotic-like serine/threonine-protein kinase